MCIDVHTCYCAKKIKNLMYDRQTHVLFSDITYSNDADAKTMVGVLYKLTLAERKSIG